MRSEYVGNSGSAERVKGEGDARTVSVFVVSASESGATERFKECTGAVG